MINPIGLFLFGMSRGRRKVGRGFGRVKTGLWRMKQRFPRRPFRRF